MSERTPTPTTASDGLAGSTGRVDSPGPAPGPSASVDGAPLPARTGPAPDVRCDGRPTEDAARDEAQLWFG